MATRHPVPTLLNIPSWVRLMSQDPDKALVDLLQYGFPVNYTKSQEPMVPFTNHHSANVHSAAVDKYILKEVSLGATMGPFSSNPLDSAIILSPLQTVPKKCATDPTARRVVLDLSYPHTGTSVNAGIPKDSYLGQATTLTYPSVDSLVHMVLTHGKGCLLFKVDLSRAFRQLYLCPCCIKYCAYQWRDYIFIDLTFPFGIRSACLNCQRVAEAVVRIYKREHNYDMIGYIDDFGSAQPPSCADQAYQALLSLLTLDLGFAVAQDKCVPPSTCMTFLGIEIDSVALVLRIPQDKISRALQDLVIWTKRQTASKKQLQSLLGTLHHIATAVKPGRRFVARIIEILKGMDAQSSRATLDSEFHMDIKWWSQFMQEYNGVSLMQDIFFSEPDAVLQSDSCLTGCGAITGQGCYFHAEFPPFITNQHLSITCLELLAIVVSCKLWGHQWARYKLVVQCDNQAVCSSVNSNKSKHPFIQAALRELWFLEAKHDFTLRCIHIPGIENTAADHLSRWHMSPSHQQQFDALTAHRNLRATEPSPALFTFNYG